jgi:hypothetical protein
MNTLPEVGSIVYLSSVNPEWGPRYIPFIGSLFVVDAIYNTTRTVGMELAEDSRVGWVVPVRYIEQFDPRSVLPGHGPMNKHLIQGLPQ